MAFGSDRSHITSQNRNEIFILTSKLTLTNLSHSYFLLRYEEVLLPNALGITQVVESLLDFSIVIGSFFDYDYKIIWRSFSILIRVPMWYYEYLALSHPKMVVVLFSYSVVSDFLLPRGLQHVRLPCPSPSCRASSNLCPLNQWCHPTISSSVIPFFPCLQFFPALGSLLMTQLFVSGGQSTGVSTTTSVLPVNIQDWFSLGLTGLISLQSKGLSRVFSITTVQKHQFFSPKYSLVKPLFTGSLLPLSHKGKRAS